jgi:hypothetical protein
MSEALVCVTAAKPNQMFDDHRFVTGRVAKVVEI